MTNNKRKRELKCTNDLNIYFFTVKQMALLWSDSSSSFSIITHDTSDSDSDTDISVDEGITLSDVFDIRENQLRIS